MKKDDFDFYPRQKIDDVNPDLKQTFRDIDFSTDGELSEKEIETYHKILKCKDSKIDYSLKNMLKNGFTGTFTTLAILLSSTFGVLGAVGCGLCALEQHGHASSKDFILKPFLLLGGFVAASLCMDSVTGLIEGGMKINKNNSLQEQKIEELKQELKKAETDNKSQEKANV